MVPKKLIKVTVRLEENLYDDFTKLRRRTGQTSQYMLENLIKSAIEECKGKKFDFSPRVTWRAGRGSVMEG